MTTLFENASLPVVPAIDAPARPQKRGWLPLLTVLFLISYALMTMLIVEQGQTIESQRVLIHELFRDSSELTAMKLKAQQAARIAATANDHAQAPSPQVPFSQVPQNQAPSSQAQANIPSSQAAPQSRTQLQSDKHKPEFKMPSRPASDLTDDRRALKTI